MVGLIVSYQFAWSRVETASLHTWIGQLRLFMELGNKILLIKNSLGTWPRSHCEGNQIICIMNAYRFVLVMSAQWCSWYTKLFEVVQSRMIKPKSVQSCGSKVPIQEYAGIRQNLKLVEKFPKPSWYWNPYSRSFQARLNKRAFQALYYIRSVATWISK
jgi:hypothetical protein